MYAGIMETCKGASSKLSLAYQTRILMKLPTVPVKIVG